MESLRPAVIDRPRLVDRLEQQARRRIAIVSAPAGYGKSVLLREYLARGREGAIFYRLRSPNATAIGFVRGLVRALAEVGPAPPLAEFVYSNGSRNKARLLEWFLESFASFDGTVVVDDLHIATANRAVGDFVARVVDESSARWIVATRSLARLPLASWVARGDLGAVITERELSLSAADATAISRASGVADDGLVSHVASLAKGWPAAFSFGIGLAADGYAPRGVTRHTSAFVYQLLAEQVLAALQPEEREFLLDTWMLPSVDPQALGAGGHDAARIVASLQQHAAFVQPDRGGSFVYHDLFKEFLRGEFLKLPAAQVNARLRRACDQMLQCGDSEAAIDLCLEMDAPELAAEALERIGFDLIDGGYVDVVERAADALREHARKYPVVVALDACVESCQGNYVRADELFVDAVERTSGGLQGEIRLRYAVDLLNRREFGRAERLLASLDMREDLPAGVRAGGLAVLAFAAAQAGRHVEARAYVERALHGAKDVTSPRAVAILHHRAALVFYALSDLARARALAASAVRLADKAAVAGLAARARTSLAVIAGELGDLGTHNRLYAELRELARAASDRSLTFVALMDSFWAEVEAGNVAAADALERELSAFDATPFSRSLDSLPSAYALRAAWEGDFAAAHGHVARTVTQLTTAARRAVRHAEVALYAEAAGLRAEAESAVEAAEEALADLDRSAARGLSRVVLARCLLALALAQRGDSAAAENAVGRVAFASAVQRKHFGPFRDAVLAFVRQPRPEGPQLEPALGRLRGTLLAGYAPLVERLRDRDRVEPREAGLSAAERAVLAHVQRGLSSKEIAAAMSRSPQTVDTHVKSILRKLNCRGRSEAVYVARRRGLLD